MMNVLVTGGAGFIGSHIVEHLQNHAEIRVLDNLRSGFKRNLNGPRHEFIAGSILDRDLVRKAVQGVALGWTTNSIATCSPAKVSCPVHY